MKCPHCRVDYFEQATVVPLDYDESGYWVVRHSKCPSCMRVVAVMQRTGLIRGQGEVHPFGEAHVSYLVLPRTTLRPSPPAQVPPEFAADYVEAAAVLNDSPKASAALSRRCLQHIIREKAQIKARDLAAEIQLLLDSNVLPSWLAEAVDAVRNIGNFAAHPIKSTQSGEVLPVEPGEAEWTLDVLDGLFDFYFVQPALLLEKRAQLNAKLAQAGKPALKG